MGWQASYRLSGKCTLSLTPAWPLPALPWHSVISEGEVPPRPYCLLGHLAPSLPTRGLEVVGWGECWCWGALDPLNLGEGRSACLSSLGVYPELRAVAWVAPLTGLWRRPGRKEVQSWHWPTLLGQDWGLWGRSFPGTRGARAEDGAEAGFHSCGQGRRVVMCPSLTLLTVVYGGVEWAWERVAFRQFELFFPGSGTAAKTQACLLPLRQLCP